MGRGRISMQLIEKEKARKTTFYKRKKGLMKKVYEFSTLCAVDVSAIIYAPKFLDKLETWPQDSTEVERVIKKYQNTTSDRRLKVYDVQEYFSDRLKKIEGEISKVQKEKMKIMYPTWDDSYNTLGHQQLRMFVNILDAKLDSCNQRMNLLKRDSKGKAIAVSNHLNFMHKSQPQIFPPMNTDDNQVAFYPSGHLSQSSKSSMFHNFGQNCAQLMGKNECAKRAADLDRNENGSDEKHQNSSSCYYNDNMQTMHPYNVALPTLPSQLLQYDSTFQILSDPPLGLDGFCNEALTSQSSVLLFSIHPALRTKATVRHSPALMFLEALPHFVLPLPHWHIRLKYLRDHRSSQASCQAHRMILKLLNDVHDPSPMGGSRRSHDAQTEQQLQILTEPDMKAYVAVARILHQLVLAPAPPTLSLPISFLIYSLKKCHPK
ncbi:hypothetical protein VNO78_11116 [Psophocarpus tetragonolobus]|uniref:MADS-box domain-containing protein n=1 Tax=Psophocarpus tetragonolobus TaxID=3891 RepID=A0AAN9ST07_PSOTE